MEYRASRLFVNDNEIVTVHRNMIVSNHEDADDEEEDGILDLMEETNK